MRILNPLSAYSAAEIVVDLTERRFSSNWETSGSLVGSRHMGAIYTRDDLDTDRQWRWQAMRDWQIST